MTLRPLGPADLEAVVESVMRWVTHAHSRRDVRDGIRGRVETSGTMTDKELLLGVQAEGRLVGDVQARCDSLPRGVFEIGVAIFDEVDRGRGYGREAVTLLTAHLFEAEGAHRVQLSTDVANEPMRGVVQRLGFGFEGVLRGFWPESDGPHDYAMYGITKDDYEGVRARWTRTI